MDQHYLKHKKLLHKIQKYLPTIVTEFDNA